MGVAISIPTEAGEINNTPSGNVTSATVQAALNELDALTEKVANKDQPSGYAGLDSSGNLVGPIIIVGGTAAENALNTLAKGAIVMDSDSPYRIRKHDGATAGGIVLASEVVDDASPELAGDLYTQGYSLIAGTDDANKSLTIRASDVTVDATTGGALTLRGGNATVGGGGGDGGSVTISGGGGSGANTGGGVNLVGGTASSSGGCGSVSIKSGTLGSTRIQCNGTGIGFFAATPVAKQGATTDLGTALSNLGLRTAGTAYPITTSGAVGFSGTVTITDVNIVLGTSTGTKIGTGTTQKLGFWNATPIVQPSGSAQAALTNSSGGTGDGTIEAVGATNTGDVSGAINNNFTELYTLLNAMRTALVNAGLMKGSA